MKDKNDSLNWTTTNLPLDLDLKTALWSEDAGLGSLATEMRENARNERRQSGSQMRTKSKTLIGIRAVHPLNCGHSHTISFHFPKSCVSLTDTSFILPPIHETIAPRACYTLYHFYDI